ncbi:uncharacterized protein C8A04DRAFT_25477 [Dichotomopilus funicola]|uniref:Uncharacterized protein n=1 Tax=Dichotomopilus funicola TaxID=1934379 RepID=A0AAN6V8W6_9PEZI|nr:hypothetical protein C8A04DRAFT_25477 [Dichotomopilus funicola]
MSSSHQPQAPHRSSTPTRGSTSTPPPHTSSPQPQSHPGDASLDLAEPPESERLPSISTRLDFGGDPNSEVTVESHPAPRRSLVQRGLSLRDRYRDDSDKRSITVSPSPSSPSDRTRDYSTGPHTVELAADMASEQSQSQQRQSREQQSQSSPASHETGDNEGTDGREDGGGEDGQSEVEEVLRSDIPPPDEKARTRETEKEGEEKESGAKTPERPKTPAYVAPIPKIGGIPKISPGISGIQISDANRPQLPDFVGELLKGKLVDEDGDIIDEKIGQVLAHAAGDLPSMVGRRVANVQGDILGDNGELLGYVADVEWPRARPPPSTTTGGQPRSLFDLMGRATSSLMVDHAGNILDGEGNVVGKFHDNNNPLHRKEKEERAEVEKQKGSTGDDETEQSPAPAPKPPPPQSAEQHQQEYEEESGQDDEDEEDPEQEPSQSPPGGNDEKQQKRPRRTEEERRKNAEAWRKENPNESPSDIFLDVKSTREGIQLTIRIPTVFNGQQTTPHISFS